MNPRRQCVVLAGGLGTRMRPMTDAIPKSMLPVKGKPFVHYQLEWLASEGITDVVYSIGYLGGMIRDYVADGRTWGVRAVYVDEGERLLGTGGALRLALDQGVLDPAFAVLYGDSFLRVSLADMWGRFDRLGSPALMAVLKNQGQWDRSNAIYHDGRVVLFDKTVSDPSMQYIDYGVSILSDHVIADLRSGEAVDLATVYNGLSRTGQLAGFEVTERFFEIGSPQGLADFERHIATTTSGARRP